MPPLYALPKPAAWPPHSKMLFFSDS